MEVQSFQIWAAFLVPVIISGLKYVSKGLDGPAAFWVNTLVQFLVGVAAALQTGEPTLGLAGLLMAAPGTWLYEGQKRIKKDLMGGNK